MTYSEGVVDGLHLGFDGVLLFAQVERLLTGGKFAVVTHCSRWKKRGEERTMPVKGLLTTHFNQQGNVRWHSVSATNWMLEPQ